MCRIAYQVNSDHASSFGNSSKESSVGVGVADEDLRPTSAKKTPC